MPSQCAVGRAGTVPGRTEAPSYMNYSRPAKQRSVNVKHMPGSSRRRRIPGAISGVHQLVVSRYGRLQGRFDARLTGRFEHELRNVPATGAAPRLVA